MSQAPELGKTRSPRSMQAEILHGLLRPRKRIASKYFYDQRGSALFEQICEQPEYYLTRVELSIIETHGLEMAEAIGKHALFIEYGSGNSTKTRLLLELLSAPAAYVPIDISGEQLQQTVAQLSVRYPDLEVLPICADFARRFELPVPRRRASKHVVYFPGSTIGNFSPRSSIRLLRNIAIHCGAQGGLLIGVDLKKDPRTLIPAYSDAAGVTRQFNLNLLRRINRQLGADFDIDQFEHHACYNPRWGRMESHLVSSTKQTVRLAGTSIHFQTNETIHTENSYKYTLDQFAALAAAAGFKVRQVWTAPASFFSVQYLTVC